MGWLLRKYIIKNYFNYLFIIYINSYLISTPIKLKFYIITYKTQPRKHRDHVYWIVIGLWTAYSNVDLTDID